MQLLSYIMLFVFLLQGCNPDLEIPDKIPLIAKDTTQINEKNNKLFVFIGRKIELERMPVAEESMDNGFKAKYKIIQRVYGAYSRDTIGFEVYDHYGIPPFSKFEYVLLFVSEIEGKYYHQKYMYNDVYKTKDDRWAGTYDADDYHHELNKETKIKPVKIEFKRKISYPINRKELQKNEVDVDYYYPEKYFTIMNDIAIANYGNYVEDLFKLKKEGVLTARNLFGNKKYEHPPIIIEGITFEVDDSSKNKKTKTKN
jgi:hypothetical protein